MRSDLKAIIFDHGTLLGEFDNSEVIGDLRKLLPWLKEQGLSLVVFSTNPIDGLQQRLKDRSLPSADLFLTIEDVGAKKGSPAWVSAAARCLGVGNHQFAYVGDDDRDWKSAMNAATFYFQAGWAGRLPDRISALRVATPRELARYLTHFLMTPPRWTYSLESEEHGLYLRSLLPATVTLPSSTPSAKFTLQSIFTHNREVTVGGEPARNLLMLHALSSLYVEGLVAPRSLFAAYPSHTPGKISEELRGYLDPAASFFGTFFRPNLLVRWAEAKDTSIEKTNASRENRPADVSILDQANSVHVNTDGRNVVTSKNRTIVVFDDFTSTGASLEWARNLLYEAGAHRVVIVTIGKYGRSNYGRSHRMHLPLPATTLHPYEPRTYGMERLFSVVPHAMCPDETAETIIRTSFERLKEGKVYPVNRL